MHIGIIGGGQLAKMLVLAGYPMGQKFIILDPAKDAAAGSVAEQIIASYDDTEKLKLLAEQTDVITFDFENVPAASIKDLSLDVPVYPPPQALEISQDRLREKEVFSQYGIATANYHDVQNLNDLHAAVQIIGYPAILKTRRLGYDGKGQYILKDHSDIEPAWNSMCQQASILESFVAFDFEVSLLAVRSKTGETAFYPLVKNTHKDGILRLSIAPYEDQTLQNKAQQLITPVLHDMEYVGVLAVEFFVKDNELIANEMAPRVHNTGHWTIEGAGVSQFENHLRAILGLPLGSTDGREYAAMLNFISTMPKAEEVLSIPGCHFHDYGKAPRPGRKLGHATLRAGSPDELTQKIRLIENIIAAAGSV